MIHLRRINDLQVDTSFSAPVDLLPVVDLDLLKLLLPIDRAIVRRPIELNSKSQLGEVEVKLRLNRRLAVAYDLKVWVVGTQELLDIRFQLRPSRSMSLVSVDVGAKTGATAEDVLRPPPLRLHPDDIDSTIHARLNYTSSSDSVCAVAFLGAEISLGLPLLDRSVDEPLLPDVVLLALIALHLDWCCNIDGLEHIWIVNEELVGVSGQDASMCYRIGNCWSRTSGRISPTAV